MIKIIYIDKYTHYVHKLQFELDQTKKLLKIIPDKEIFIKFIKVTGLEPPIL